MTVATDIPEHFNSPTADFVIRTADGASLKVHRCILEASSPFWQGLLSLPQSMEPLDLKHLPHVDVPEDSFTISCLLQLIYPIPDPKFASISEISSILTVAVKYEMTQAISTLTSFLLSPLYLSCHATRIYAIACQHGLEDLAKEASKATLNLPMLSLNDPLHEDFKYISAFDYHRLLSLHLKRSKAAQDIIRPPLPPNPQPAETTIPNHIPPPCPQCSSVSHFGLQLTPRWWTEFENQAVDELARSPVSDVIFSWPFLAKVAKKGCQRCGTSIIEAYDFLMKIKREIDELPDTV